GAAFMILAQSAYGVLQVASRGSFEISALLGAGPGAALREFQSDLQQEWHRARGTLGHPNILAPWLMLLAPAFLAMSTVIRDRALQLVCFTVGAVGLVGVAFTLSRAAWAVAFVQMCILAAALTWMGALKARQTLGIAVVVGLAGVLATAPFIDTLVERVTRDFVASVDFRAEYNEDALAIFMKSPAIGVGPNNFVHYLPEYDPTINDFLEEANTVRKLVNIRVIAAVHNMYLLLLAEIGILGIAAFFVFIAGALHRGMRAVANTSGPLQMASLGLTIGILGVMGVQFTEFSLWVDPVLYTFALTVALLNNAPGIQAAQAAPESVDV
ncbi:MAG: O-antigen ligase family protein, partial [Planctomycetota bacterium]|nr:O-antigen ligase family protein [Planctomycetota bacterium]